MTPHEQAELQKMLAYTVDLPEIIRNEALMQVELGAIVSANGSVLAKVRGLLLVENLKTLHTEALVSIEYTSGEVRLSILQVPDSNGGSVDEARHRMPGAASRQRPESTRSTF